MPEIFFSQLFRPSLQEKTYFSSFSSHFFKVTYFSSFFSFSSLAGFPELAPDDSLLNDDWIAEVNTSVDEWSSKVNEYLLSRPTDPPSNVMSNDAWTEECLESLRNMSQRENNYQTWQLNLIIKPSQAINKWFTQILMTERKW